MPLPYRITALTLVACLLVACGTAAQPLAGDPPAPTATVAPLFRPLPATSAPPAVAPVPTASTLRPRATITPEQQLREVLIYSDTLSSDWTDSQSWGVNHDMAASIAGASGQYAIAVTPIEDFGAFFLALRPDAVQPYPRDQVVAVSFLLGSGDGMIAPDDLAVTVLGSNEYAYWQRDDRSVPATGRVTDGSPTFSETQLAFLDILHTIPPQRWVEVVVTLDALEFDPHYRYLTGLYIKNAAGFHQRFYIDQVKLLINP